MTFDALLSELGTHLGIELQADAERCCSVVFDEAVNVTFEAPAEAPGVLFIHALVGFVPVRDEAAFFAMLLEANRFGAGTGGNVLSVEVETGNVLLHRSLTMEVQTAQSLTAELENFVAWAKLWMDTIMAFRPPTVDALRPGADDVLVKI